MSECYLGPLINAECLVAKLIADARDESVARARIYIPRVASAAFCQALHAAAVASLLTAVITVALEPLVPSCAAPRLPVAEPVYSADAVYDQVRESTVLAVENAKHAVGMA